MITYRILRNWLHRLFGDYQLYKFAHSFMDSVPRKILRALQRFITKFFKKFGVVLVWDRYATIPNFQSSRVIIFHGFFGPAYFGRKYYLSRASFRTNYRSDPNLVSYLFNICDISGRTLTPISFIEAPLVKDGGVAIKGRVKHPRRYPRYVWGDGPSVLSPRLPGFGHFYLQLLPFLLTNSKNFSLIFDADDERSLEILNHYGVFPKEFSKNSPENLRAIPSVLLGARQEGIYPGRDNIRLLKETLVKSDLRPGNFKRIYLSRRGNTNGRDILNENLLIIKLSQMGFARIDPGNFSFEEQLRLFAGADIIVGPHGSAFANLVACRQGIKVVEINGDIDVRWHWKKMALDLDLNHLLILGITDPNGNIIIEVGPVIKAITDFINGELNSIGP